MERGCLHVDEVAVDMHFGAVRFTSKSGDKTMQAIMPRSVAFFLAERIFNLLVDDDAVQRGKVAKIKKKG